MRFGAKLAALRKERGMTQAELAQKAGLSLKTITNYETKATYPRNSKIYATLAEVLACQEEDLHNEVDDFLAIACEYGCQDEASAMKMLGEVTRLFLDSEPEEEEEEEDSALTGVLMEMLMEAWLDRAQRALTALENDDTALAGKELSSLKKQFEKYLEESEKR